MKVFRFLLNSVILFWTYFVSSIFVLFLIQMPMRFLIPGESKGEYLWKTIVLYLAMVIVCTVHLLVRSPTHKVRYLQALGEGTWSFPSACKYTVRNPGFWYQTAGFAPWPVILPRLFGVIHKFYFSESFLQAVPGPIVSLIVVDVPFVILSFLTWVFILRHWSLKRIHVREQNRDG